MDLENLFSKYANQTYNAYIITINESTPQTFTHTFADGRVFQVFLRYNRQVDMWVMDIYLQISDTELQSQVLGVPLCFGLNLFASFKYLNLGEFYVFPKDYRNTDSPSYNNLADQFIYVWRH